MERQRAQLQNLLKDELGFDEKQVRQFLILRQEHHEQMQKLSQEIRRIKKQMFDEVLRENPQSTLSDSLLNLAQNKQAQIEKLTFQHFLNLKKLCKPEQRENLKLLMNELFRKQRQGKEGPPPPPDGLRPPPQRNIPRGGCEDTEMQ